MLNVSYKVLYGQNKKSQVHSFFLLAAVLAVAFMVFNVVGLTPKLLIAISAIVAFGIAFVNTEFALILLLFSMLLSPEISAGSAGSRDVVIRADDIFLGVVILGWFARMAVKKDLALFKHTPLNMPIALFLMTSLISTLFGAITGTVSPVAGFFYWLKSFEYFLLFFMVSNIVTTKEQAKRYIYVILIVCAIISAYAWFQRLTGVARVSTPFEGRGGEANTLGGYVVMIMMVCMGIFFTVKDKLNKYFSLGLLLVSAPVLLFTLSRGSWVAFIPAAIVFGVIVPRGKFFYALTAISMVLFAASIFPKEVKDRFYYTFEEQRTYNFFGREITLDESAAARVDSWAVSWNRMTKSPIIGLGVGSGGIIDNQYARILVEQGMLGLFIFLVLIFRIFNLLFWIRKNYNPDDLFFKGLICGYIAALVSLLFHSLSAATFIIIRIIEPFWFLTAIVLKLPFLIADNINIEEDNGANLG